MLRSPMRLSQLGEQSFDALLALSDIATGKKVRVVEDVVQVVEVASHAVAVVERPRRAIGAEEVHREPAEELRHRDVGFAVSYIDRGIEDRGRLALDRRGVAVPQVAMQQRLPGRVAAK